MRERESHLNIRTRAAITIVAASTLIGACSASDIDATPRASEPTTINTSPNTKPLNEAIINDADYYTEAAAGNKPVTTFQGVYLITPVKAENEIKIFVTFSPFFRPNSKPDAKDATFLCMDNDGTPNVLPMAGTSMVIGNDHADESLIKGYISDLNGKIEITDQTTGQTQEHRCEMRSGTREQVEQQLLRELNAKQPVQS